MKGRLSRWNLKNSWVVFILFWSSGMFSQSSFGRCTLTTQKSIGTPIPDVQIYNLSTSSELGLTDEKGILYTDCDWKSSDTLLFQKVGFKTLQSANIGPNDVITLEPTYYLLDEVEIVGRSDWSSTQFAQKIEVLGQQEIAELRGTSTADVLESSGDVFVQRSQLGGGSPIIRGFEANRILLVVDGVRLNNAIYRSGHLHNSFSVDQFALDQVEIHAGPNSLLYGSDALGGVLHFKTKNAPFAFDSDKKHTVHLGSMFQSAANAWSNHIDISFSRKKWSSFSSLSYAVIGDLRSGHRRPEQYPELGKRNIFVERINGQDVIKSNSDPNVQLGSGFDQWDFIQKFNFRPAKDHQLGLNFQWNTASAPRYDQLNIIDSDGNPEYAEWEYTPQERLLASLHYDIFQGTTLFDRAKVIASVQRVREGRRRRFLNSTQRFDNQEFLNVGGLNLDLIKSWGASSSPWRCYYGLEIQVNDLESSATETNITTGTIDRTVLSRYPSGDNLLATGGIYGMVRKDFFNEKLDVEGGVRQNFYRVQLSYDQEDRFEWPKEYIEGVAENGLKTTFSGSLSYHPHPWWSLQYLTATAYRAPNIDDIAKIRIKNGQVLTPNLNLRPETAWNNEWSISFHAPAFQVRGTVFKTEIQDLIARRNGALPNGDTVIVSDGIPFRVQVNDNVDQGSILGWSVDLKQKFRNWTLAGSVTHIEGILDAEEGTRPLGHIPPLYGRLGLQYQHSSWSTGANVLFNGKKPLDEYDLGGSDNEEYATEEGTLAWWTLNAHLGYKREDWSAHLRADNILDTNYRTFASGISSAGLNLVLQLEYRIGN